MLRRGHHVDQCITISPDLGKRQEVAGYLDLREPLDLRQIPLHTCNTYALREDQDGDSIRSLGIDLLFVIGWQRLIPDWFLTELRLGAFGMHGSSLPLPHGRGRSPMNWSLVQGRDKFYTHLFRYKPGVDDGDIAGVQCFDITPFDTCLTMHYKNTMAMISLVDRLIDSLCSDTAVLQPQNEDGATYYPKRSREDGLIDWTASTATIYNLIRAVTAPFPGAFTHLDNKDEFQLNIWKAIPFDEQMVFPDSRPGQIIQQFQSGDFVVQTGTSSLLVTEWEMTSGPSPKDLTGRMLGNAGRSIKDWGTLPRPQP